MAGTLFVVATPIGNLEDITLRALRTLREVDLIAAEDTRRTAKLLAHHNIHRPMVSLHEHNEYREAPKLIERIVAGISVALVSDAGTPGISDPGEHLVRLAHERQVKVSPIPGPSAIAAALSASGQPASEFVFMGFPPRSGKARQDWMARLAAESRTVVAFESPHRVESTLQGLRELLVERQIQIHRELTKLNEEFVISPIISADRSINTLGEFVLVIEPVRDTRESQVASKAKTDKAALLVGCMTTTCGFELQTAIMMTSRALELEPSAVKKAWKKHRILANRSVDELP
jgi:16S rRNA (cytidine1402-2'-O)-methyltransferase